MSVIDQIESAVDVVEKLQNAGHQAVFAGGCVRDMLLGVEPKDIDIATSASPDQVEGLFEKTVAVGKSFGVIRVLHDDYEFEVATFRKDSKEGDGRRPESVEFSSIQEDAKRRDLTINSIFLDPINDKILDFVGGQEDLKRKIIRMVGNPHERIEEDKLRMLRVIRFASRFGWRVEAVTHNAVIKHASEINVVSKERIADELGKMFSHEKAHVAFRMMLEHDLWTHVLPQVGELVNCKQDPKWHPEGDVFTHTELMLRNAGKNLVNNKVLAWAIILHDIGKPATFAINEHGRITAHGHAEVGSKMAREILENLRFDSKTLEQIVWLVDNHMRMFDVQKMKQATRMKLIANENFDNLLELHRLDCVSSNGNLETFEFIKHVRESTPLSQIKPERLVDGNDLIALGLKPGIQFREILEQIADLQREGKVTDRAQALEKVKEILQK